MREIVSPPAGAAKRSSSCNVQVALKGVGITNFTVTVMARVKGPPPDRPLEQSSDGYWTQASPRLTPRPPSGKAGNSQLSQRAVLRRPPRERQVDLSQNGYSLSLSLFFFFFHRVISLHLYISLSAAPSSTVAYQRPAFPRFVA